MKNAYGNYVVQKALKIATGELKTKLINLINKNLDKMPDKKLVGKWKGIVNNTLGNRLSLNDNGPVNLDLSRSSINSANSPQHSPNRLGNNIFSPRMWKSQQSSPMKGISSEPMLYNSPKICRGNGF